MKKWNDTYPETPSGFRNRVEMTLAGLEEREMKRTFAKTPLLVFAIIAVMLAATAFAATQFFGGFVDWDGNMIPLEEPIVKATMPPEQIVEWEDYSDILSDVPSGEYWVIWHDGGGSGSYGTVGDKVYTAEDIRTHLIGSELLIAEAPEGFETNDAELAYDLHDVPCEEYAKESLGNGATLVKSRHKAVTDEDIDGYILYFRDGDMNWITVFAHIHAADNYEDGVNSEFFIEEGDEYEVLEIMGFDRAIAIKGADGTFDISLQKDSEDGKYIFNYKIYTNWEIPAEELVRKLFR